VHLNTSVYLILNYVTETDAGVYIFGKGVYFYVTTSKHQAPPGIPPDMRQNMRQRRSFCRSKRRFRSKYAAKHAAAPFVPPFKTPFLVQPRAKTLPFLSLAKRF
jgi:hypothetical protein